MIKTVTEQEINQFRTSKGGFSIAQVKFAQSITGDQHWKKAMLKKSILLSDWHEFCRLAGDRRPLKKLKEKSKKTIINSMPKPDGWAWKPPQLPPVKRESKNNKNRGRKSQRREQLSQTAPQEFYASKEWRSLRVRVLEKYDCKCMMCGRSHKTHGVVIHVDHIKPRSKFPELALVFENLQILCEDCNLGKSNKYDTDHRPDGNTEDWELLETMPVTMQ